MSNLIKGAKGPLLEEFASKIIGQLTFPGDRPVMMKPAKSFIMG